MAELVRFLVPMLAGYMVGNVCKIAFLHFWNREGGE